MVNNSDNNGNTGLKGRFRDRLRLIRISRYKRIKGIKQKELDNKRFVEDKIKEIRKVIWKDNNSYRKDHTIKLKGVKKKQLVVGDKNREVIVNNDLVKKGIVNDNCKVKEDNIANLSYDTYLQEVRDNIKKTRDDRDYAKRYGVDNKRVNKRSYRTRGIKKNLNDVTNKNKNDLFIDELKVKIIKRIRGDFYKRICELDVLESELYFLEDDNNKEMELDKIKELKKQINDIVDKINNIIIEYNIYVENYVFENIIDINDGLLVDDIIKFRDIVSSDDNRRLVNDYKLLAEFQDLYSRLDYISGVANNLVSKNSDKIDKYNVRDKKYDHIKKELVLKENILDECDIEIDRQNKYFQELIGKVNKIDSRNYTTYKFVGINNLVSQSLRYVGLLMISPLAGLIPSIAINTLATRKILSNIYKNMHIEKINKIEYMATDYETGINNKLNDIDYTYDIIDDTINMIRNLKDDFMKFYNPSIKGYSDTLRKLDRIYDSINNNRYKMDIIKNNLIGSKKINSDKLVKVKELNNGN